MKALIRRYETRIVGIFLASLIIYLLVAYFYHAPRGYYGTIEQPRFADPWIARGETLLGGGLLYRDVFTSTPPLTNFIFIPPVWVSSLFGHVNPWATLSCMVYFSLFNLFGAFVLLYMAENRAEGYYAAAFFLLNPLTFGNTILRRQDESIVVFFIGLSLLLLLRQQHARSAIMIGLSMMVKLTGAVTLPIALLHTRKWHYVVLPAVVFLLVMTPFFITAGRDAMFWDVSQTHTEHPFQYGGVSPGALWNRYHEEAEHIPLVVPSVLFVAGVGLTAVFITWKRFGILEDTTILIAMVLILSPKLHTGYFSMPALTMAPLLKKYKLEWAYLLFGMLALIADFYKWPIENFPIAFYLMGIALLLLLGMVIRIVLLPNRPKSAAVSQ